MVALNRQCCAAESLPDVVAVVEFDGDLECWEFKINKLKNLFRHELSHLF